MSESSAEYIPNDHERPDDEISALSGNVVRYRSLVDGSVRIEIDLHGGLAELASMGLDHGTNVAIARLSALAAPGRQYGHYAKALRLSGFFFEPEVLRALGPDARYLEWLTQQQITTCSNGGGRCYVPTWASARCGMPARRMWSSGRAAGTWPATCRPSIA